MTIEELENSCQEGNLENVINLIDNCNISVNCKFYFNYTPLHIACIYNHPKIVLELLQRNADINAKDNSGRTPLLISTRHPEIVSILLNNQANINATDQDKMAPLHWACNYGSLDVVKLLVKHKCEINIFYSEFKINALMLSAMVGNIEIIKFLIDNGAEINHTNVLGNNILHYAAYLDHLDICLFLTREHGLDPKILNKFKESAMNSYGKSLDFNPALFMGNNQNLRQSLTTIEKEDRSNQILSSYEAYLLEKKRNENFVRRKDFLEMLFGCNFLMMKNQLNNAKKNHDTSSKIQDDKIKNYQNFITNKVFSNLDLIKFIVSFL
jgi:ankyrin repeat protein